MIDTKAPENDWYAYMLLWRTGIHTYIPHSEDKMLTSKRALSTENGLSKNPTATRVVAPASRLPWLVSVGRTEPLTFAGPLVLRTRAKYGERAMNVRSCVREVMYMATPGTFLAGSV